MRRTLGPSFQIALPHTFAFYVGALFAYEASVLLRLSMGWIPTHVYSEEHHLLFALVIGLPLLTGPAGVYGAALCARARRGRARLRDPLFSAASGVAFIGVTHGATILLGGREGLVALASLLLSAVFG